MDRTLLLYKNFLRSNAYFGKKNCILFGAWILTCCYYGIRLHFFTYDTARKLPFCIWRVSLTHILNKKPVIHLQFLTVLELRFDRKVLMIFGTSKQLVVKTGNIEEKWTSQTYIAAYRRIKE